MLGEARQDPLTRWTDWLFRGRVGPGLIALGSVVAWFAGIRAPQMFNDGDTYWHLATGEWILRHHAVPKADPFSYTFFGQPWHAHEWLTEILMALAFRGASWNGLSLLFGGCFAAFVLVLGRYLSRCLAVGPWIAILALVMGCVLPSMLARPHLIALPLLALWLSELLIARERQQAPSLWLLMLMPLWANLHGSFVVGLGLTAVFALEALVEHHDRPKETLQSWVPFGLAAGLLSLATPQGVAGLTFALKVSSMTTLPLIAEWKSPSFAKLSALEVLILEALLVCLWRGVKVPLLRLIVLLGFLHLTLQHVRHQSVFALVAAMLLAEPLARAFSERVAARPTKAWPSISGVAAAVALALMGAVWRLQTPSVRTDSLSAPISALAAVPPQLRERPMFNAYSFGGYLIFKGLRPFIDGRGDMYGDRFMRIYGAMTHPKLAVLRGELDARRIDWVVVTAGEPVVGALDAMSEWRRLHSDTYAVVFVRRTVADALNVGPPDAASVRAVSPLSNLQTPAAR